MDNKTERARKVREITKSITTDPLGHRAWWMITNDPKNNRGGGVQGTVVVTCADGRELDFDILRLHHADAPSTAVWEAMDEMTKLVQEVLDRRDGDKAMENSGTMVVYDEVNARRTIDELKSVVLGADDVVLSKLSDVERERLNKNGNPSIQFRLDPVLAMNRERTIAEVRLVLTVNDRRADWDFPEGTYQVDSNTKESYASFLLTRLDWANMTDTERDTATRRTNQYVAELYDVLGPLLT
jgi:hypothetical protein